MVGKPSRILAVAALLAGFAATAGLSGCVLERETTLSRAARQREVQALRAARERLERERDILIGSAGELQVEIGNARRETVETAALLRATLAALDHELGKLQTAEQDLVAARRRAQQIERELEPLRELEKTLAQQEELRAAAHKRVELLQQEVEAAEAAARQATTTLQPKLDALKAELQQAQQIEKALTDAKAAVEAAAKLLAPEAGK